MVISSNNNHMVFKPMFNHPYGTFIGFDAWPFFWMIQYGNENSLIHLIDRKRFAKTLDPSSLSRAHATHDLLSKRTVSRGKNHGDSDS